MSVNGLYGRQQGRNGPYGRIYPGAFVTNPLDWSLASAQLNPVPSALSGAGAWRSAAPGTIQGQFGWANPATGLISNTRVTAADQIGVVIPQRSSSGASVVGMDYSYGFYDPAVKSYRIRPGLEVTLIASGPMWLQFQFGAYPGEPVYASLVDGSAISGPATNAELTPWVVTSQGSPGSLAIVSTTAKFT